MSWLNGFSSKRFGQIPAESMLDIRFKGRHHQVYAVLCLHAGLAGSVAITTLTLSEFTGINQKEISKVTTSLKDWGYLIKKQHGFNDALTYRLLTPVIPSEFVRKVTPKRIADETHKENREVQKAKGKARFAELAAKKLSESGASAIVPIFEKRTPYSAPDLSESDEIPGSRVIVSETRFKPTRLVRPHPSAKVAAEAPIAPPRPIPVTVRPSAYEVRDSDGDPFELSATDFFRWFAFYLKDRRRENEIPFSIVYFSDYGLTKADATPYFSEI